MPFDIVLVDDHKLVRDGVKGILERGTEFRVIGEAENGADAVQICRKNTPDMVLMDIGLPGKNGLQAIAETKARKPRVQFIICTVFDDDEKIFNALNSVHNAVLNTDKQHVKRRLKIFLIKRLPACT